MFFFLKRHTCRDIFEIKSMTSIILLKYIYWDVGEKQQGQLVVFSRRAFDDAYLRDGK